MIYQFKDQFKFLSNFYHCIIIFNDLIFPSVEHAFVASKSLSKSFHILIQKDPDPRIAKKLGRKIKLRKDWEIVKIPFMDQFLRQKYSNNMFRVLLNTLRNEYLEEGNTWHDNFWGNCYCDKCKNIKGQNKLGKLIMNIRDV